MKSPSSLDQGPEGGGNVTDTSLSVGVPMLDQQHRQILVLIGELANCPNDMVNSEKVGEILAMIVALLLKHFQLEEEFLKQTDIAQAEFDVFVREHNAIADFLIQLQYRAISEQVMKASDLHEILYTKLLSHLVNSDMAIRRLTLSEEPRH